MMEVSEKKGGMEKKSSPPPAASPLRPTWATRRRAAAVKSVTRDEIERFWRRKRMEEEDHLLAALKAAARIRTRTLKEDDYKRFEASLEGVLNSSPDATKKNTGEDDAIGQDSGKNHNKKELRAVIRNWWTKSRYAYLNQPAIKAMEPEEATPNFAQNSCCYAAVSTKPCSALGVF